MLKLCLFENSGEGTCPKKLWIRHSRYSLRPIDSIWNSVPGIRRQRPSKRAFKVT